MQTNKSGVPVADLATWWLLCLRTAFVLGVFLIPATAHGNDLSGTWNASSLRVSWSIGDWGEACGPRPKGGGERGGTVTLAPAGVGFQLKGLGRNYSSTECWERMPRLTPRSRTAGSSAISTTCRMPDGDPRQAKVVTSWFPRGDKLYFDETGQYQFVVSGSNCTASVRRTRVLTRVVSSAQEDTAQKEVSKKPTSVPARSGSQRSKKPSVAPPPPPERASRCKTPGSPVRIEVTPKTKLMRQGESFTFKAIARDKIGCRVPVKARWSLISKSDATLTADGRLTVPENVNAQTLSLEAKIGEDRVQVAAKIVSDEQFEQLIAGGEYGVLGESLDAAEVKLSSGHIEVDPVELNPERKKRVALFVLAGFILALGLLILFLLRRRHTLDAKKSEASLHEATPAVVDEQEGDSIKTAQAKPASALKPNLPRLCPVCGQRYKDGVQFCGNDGARTMRAN